MIVQPFLTYYSIAEVEFDTYHGDEVKCIIKSRTDEKPLGPEIFKAKGNPLIITMKESTSDTFAPIKTSEAILHVHNLENFQALGILARGNRDYQLEVQYNSVTIWQGWMVPDQWTEPFTATPYPSEFTFIDGLSMLKNIDFADVDGCYYRGRYRDLQIMGYLLSLTEIDRRFVDQINIIDENTTAPDKFGTFFEKFKDVEAFRGMTAYEVIEKILISYGARVEYFNDKYYFRRVRENGATINSYEYRLQPGGTASLESAYVYDNVLDVTCLDAGAARVSWVGGSQELFRLPGVKKLTINQDYGRKESIIPRSFFNDCDWQDENTLRFWNGNGIKKTVVEDETCVEFLPWTPATSPYVKPAYIEMTMSDVYDVTNVTSANKDLFELQIICRNGTYIPSEVNPYVGKRVSFGTTTGTGRAVAPATSEFRQVETTQITVQSSTIDGNYYFVMPLSFWDDRGLAYPTLGEKMIFRNVDDLPIGYNAGYPYLFEPSFVFPVVSPTHYYFLLKEDENPFSIKRPDAADNEKEFNVAYFFTYLPVEFEFNGNQMDLFGEFLTFNYLDIEISRRDIENQRFFVTGTESTTELTSALYSTGPMSLRIEKPTENKITTRGVDGSFFIESVKLTIKDTPENETETIILDSKNNIDLELNIMFAETPIKNNFRNNNLKYYNNFYSRSTITEPGLQIIDHVDTSLVTLRTMYRILRDDYVSLLSSPRRGLSGTLNAPTSSPIGKILAESYTDANYIMTSCNYNVYLHQYEAEWHEVGVKNQPAVLGAYSDAYSNAYDN